MTWIVRTSTAGDRPRRCYAGARDSTEEPHQARTMSEWALAGLTRP